MERDTKELQIAGHVIVTKTYATATEANKIQQAYFKGSKVEIVGDQPRVTEFNPGVQFEVEQELIRQMVISIDGKTDALSMASDFPSSVWDEIVAALDTLVAKKKK